MKLKTKEIEHERDKDIQDDCRLKAELDSNYDATIRKVAKLALTLNWAWMSFVSGDKIKSLDKLAFFVL
ncbi:hypothetical protein G293_04985 [Candidatus Liberibacter africanus PTSAPSY]|uniref:Uncharacterized protein n=1 Tax=Candidatus Liberibacter africanus PTSAPSY TaxID=1277257 RepID=A0A0G3I9X6_LIBAF|nr:hypothetical protein G293_04985 [Candidatus Liberibacter africanus PTSAPSY]